MPNSQARTVPSPRKPVACSHTLRNTCWVMSSISSEVSVLLNFADRNRRMGCRWTASRSSSADCAFAGWVCLLAMSRRYWISCLSWFMSQQGRGICPLRVLRFRGGHHFFAFLGNISSTRLTIRYARRPLHLSDARMVSEKLREHKLLVLEIGGRVRSI